MKNMLKNESEKISHLEAFKAMQCFLEKYYEQTKSVDIGSLLGDLQILQDKTTADPTAWHDWMECINKTLHS
jgi:hypothetical protein